MSVLQSPSSTSRRTDSATASSETSLDLFTRALIFVEENRTLLYGLLAAVVALAIAIPGYLYYQQQQADAANEMLGQTLPLYEQGRYQEALDGTADRPGLRTIAEQYGGTPAGNLATFYAGDALYQIESYDEALTYFEQYDKDADFLGASAYAAEAAIYENQGDVQRAAEQYEAAATHYESDLTTPRYLLSAGRAYEKAGAYAEAQRVYTTIQDEYGDTPQAQQAERFLARVAARQGAAQ
jgi:tetratricopeptide (TPR) repeat protein